LRTSCRQRGPACLPSRSTVWLDGTLHQTWSRIGVQPRVDTYGLRKTAHVFGAVTLDDAEFTYRFADVFNGETFHGHLKQLVAKYAPRKIFFIIDNGPCHSLDDAGKAWLWDNADKIVLHRLPAYSPSSTRPRASGRPLARWRPTTASTRPPTSATARWSALSRTFNVDLV